MTQVVHLGRELLEQLGHLALLELAAARVLLGLLGHVLLLLRVPLDLFATSKEHI